MTSGPFDAYRANLFASSMMERLKQAGESRAMEYDPHGFRVLFPETGGTVNLHNFFDDYSRLSPSSVVEWWPIVLRSLLGAAEIPEDFEDAEPDLRPVVRTRSYLELMRLQAKMEGRELQQVPYVPLGDHLGVFLAYDLPSVIRYIRQERLDAWGISLYEAMEIAQQNLESLPFPMLGYEAACVYCARTGDAYDSSRLLLKDQIRSLPLDGDPVAIAVNVNCLLIAGADDVDGLQMMTQFAGSASAEPRPLCLIPLRLVQGEWESWLPPADHELHTAYHQLEMQYLFEEYSQQKLLLDEWHGQQGWEHFVAKCWCRETEAGSRSYAVWSQGVATHLPRTDEVHFYGRRGESPRRADWDRVLQTVGHMMSLDEDSYPPRWFVDTYPTEDEFATMGAVLIGG